MLSATSNSAFSQTGNVPLFLMGDNCVTLRAAARTTVLLQSTDCSASRITCAISLPMPIPASGVAKPTATAATEKPQQPSPSDIVWKLAFRAMFEELLRKPRLLQPDADSAHRGLISMANSELSPAAVQLSPVSDLCLWERALTTFTNRLAKKFSALQQHGSTFAPNAATDQPQRDSRATRDAGRKGSGISSPERFLQMDDATRRTDSRPHGRCLASNCAPRVPLLPRAVLSAEPDSTMPCQHPLHQLARTTLPAVTVVPSDNATGQGSGVDFATQIIAHLSQPAAKSIPDPLEPPPPVTSLDQPRLPSGFELLRAHCDIDAMSAPDKQTHLHRCALAVLRDKRVAALGADQRRQRCHKCAPRRALDPFPIQPTATTFELLPTVRDGPGGHNRQGNAARLRNHPA